MPLTRSFLSRRRLLLSVCLAACGCSGTPQIGVSEEAFGEVDALYTAVTSKRPQLVSECEQRLSALSTSGKLPPEAWQEIAAVCDLTKHDDWPNAAQRLWNFMRNQRRSGR